MKSVLAALLMAVSAGCLAPVQPDREISADIPSAEPEWVTFGDGYQGYLSRPPGEGPSPAVVMIHEWWGLNQNIQEMARELASEGYVVLAVDLFEGILAANPEEADALSTAARENMDAAIQQMTAAASFLRERDDVRSDAVASMGWCFGGQMALQLALNDRLQATVIYYGTLVTEEAELSRLQNPVLGIFADQDTVVPLESVREFENGLNRLEIENEIHVYSGVGHAFANPSNPGHDAEKTRDAWLNTLAFLARNLR